MVGVEGEGDLALQTVTVEDKTSAVVVWGIHAGDTRTTWNHLPDISGRELYQATWPSWLYQVEDDRGVVSEMGSCVSRFKLMFFAFVYK